MTAGISAYERRPAERPDDCITKDPFSEVNRGKRPDIYFHPMETVNQVKLSRAPAFEALIDFRVRTSEPVLVDALRASGKAVQKGGAYPTWQEQRQFQVGVVFGVGGAESSSAKTGDILGFRLDDPNRGFVLQLTRAGLTVSKLKPYDSWDELEAEAKAAWLHYTQNIPCEVIRIGVRYLNRLELPADEDLDAFLSAAPRIPPALPQNYLEFQSRTVTVCDDEEARLILTQTMEPNLAGLGKTVNVILDIDAVVEKVFDAESTALWETTLKLRHLKNKAFFSAITHRTLEMFK